MIYVIHFIYQLCMISNKMWDEKRYLRENSSRELSKLAYRPFRSCIVWLTEYRTKRLLYIGSINKRLFSLDFLSAKNQSIDGARLEEISTCWDRQPVTFITNMAAVSRAIRFSSSVISYTFCELSVWTSAKHKQINHGTCYIS